MMGQKATFTSKLGVIAATVGSAVGLGTVWRFPNEVQSNGGSVFLITYLLCVLLVGIPVMLAEFSVGRGSGSDAIGAYRKLTPRRPWWIVGVISVLAPYLIMMYYMVVAGWTLQYLWMSLSGALFDGVGSGAAEPEAFQAIMRHSLAEGWQPVFWTAVMIVVNLLVLMRGVQKGIERMANTLMPLLFVILLVFCVVSLNLPDAIDGVEYFLRPDWSKLDGGVLISAVGQAFFSLSLGMGILVTYSSYFPKSTNLPRTATTVSMLVFMVAVLMGLIIFPAVKSFGIEGSTQGTTLIFVTLPQIFMELPLPQLWAVLFFGLLVVAALTSTVSIAEVPIAYLTQTFRMPRRKACLLTLLPMLVFSTVCALSLGPWAGVQVFGMTIFDFLDYFTSNILLPVAAVGVCLYVGYGLPKRFFFKEVSNEGTVKFRYAPLFFWFVRIVAPLMILAAFANKLFFE